MPHRKDFNENSDFHANGRAVDRKVAHKDIAGILAGVNRNYFEEFDTERGHHRPGLICISCADARISPDHLLDLPPGEEFVRKPLGGFLPDDVAGERGLSGWFSLAVGVKEVKKIIMVTHSDCAAGNVALKYPTREHLPADHPKHADLCAIQDYLFALGADLQALSTQCWSEAGGEEDLATDLMTKRLALVSMQNLMGYRVCKGRTKTVGEAIIDREMDVVMLYVDLDRKGIEYFDLDAKAFRPLEEDDLPSHMCVRRNDCAGCHCASQIEKSASETVEKETQGKEDPARKVIRIHPQP